MNADDLQEIEIPSQRGWRQGFDAIGRALLAAQQNGRAIRVPVNGCPATVLQRKLLLRSRTFAKQGFRVVTAKATDGQSVAAWLVPIAPKA